MPNEKADKCYCLEIFRKKYGNHVNGKCQKLKCQRYLRENNIDPTQEKNVQNGVSPANSS